jgi:hypothetical protein
MKTSLLISMVLLISLRLNAQTKAANSGIRYPRITVSYNPIIFLKDYSIEINNSVNRSSAPDDLLVTNFNPSFKEPSEKLDIYGGHEFKLGLKPLKWIEFGLGYSWYSNYVFSDLNAQYSETYSFSDGGTHTAYENLRLNYGQRFNTFSGYVKFSIPLFKKGDDNSGKSDGLYLNPQYGIAMNHAGGLTTHAIEYPVFPDSYQATHNGSSGYSDPSVEWETLIELETGKEIINSMTNMFSLGISYDYKYISLYVDFCYYLSYNKDKLFVEHYLFEQSSTTGTHIKFPGTITDMATLKVGIAIQIPLRHK